ncbi:MAG: hypothetical protein ACOCRX_06770 [Candidatus Woesearchaeota archaeon]
MEIHNEKYRAEIIPKTYEGIANDFSELVNFIDSKSKIKIERLNDNDKLDIELIEIPVFSTDFYQNNLKELLKNIDNAYEKNLEELINESNLDFNYEENQIYFSIDFNYYGKEGKYPKVNIFSYFGRVLNGKGNNLYLIASYKDYKDPSISVKSDSEYVGSITNQNNLKRYFKIDK